MDLSICMSMDSMSLNPYTHLENDDKQQHQEGHCVGCGLQTHKVKKKKKNPFMSKLRKSTVLMMPITNEYVDEGRCLLCQPSPIEGNRSGRIQLHRNNADAFKSPTRANKQSTQEIQPSPARTVSSTNSVYSTESTPAEQSCNKESQSMDANEIAIAKAVVAIKFAKPKASKSLEHVKLVLKLMKQHPSSFRVQHAACSQVFELASECSSENAQMNPSELPLVHAAMFRQHVIGLLVQAMTSFLSSPHIHPPALGALYTLARYQAGKHYIREEGGLTALAEVHKFYSGSAMQFSEEIETTGIKTCVEIQKLCCITWANAVASGTHLSQASAAKLGALQLILHNMQHSKYDLGVSHYAAGAIANLGFKHPDNLRLIRQENGVQVLENTLTEVGKQPNSEFVVSVNNLVQAALDNLEQDALCIIHRDENQEHDGSYSIGCIEELVTLIEIHLRSEKVAVAGSRLLWQISAGSGQPPENSFVTTDDVLREVGALGLLIAILEHHIDKPTVVHLTCGAIWNLTSTNQRNQEMLRESGGLEFLVMVLVRYCQCESNQSEGDDGLMMSNSQASYSNVIIHTMCAISNAAANNLVNQTSMLAIGAIPLIVECMKNYRMDHEDVQCFSLKSLINLSEGHAENSREIVACGGLPFVLEAMICHPNHEEIQTCGCLVLTNICFYAKRGFMIALHRSDGLHVLREAADNFPNSCQIYFSEIEKSISC